MDEIVLRSMLKWPNVPSVYGWLRLDRRGQWLIRMPSVPLAPGAAAGVTAALEVLSAALALSPPPRCFRTVRWSVITCGLIFSPPACRSMPSTSWMLSPIFYWHWWLY